MPPSIASRAPEADAGDSRAGVPPPSPLPPKPPPFSLGELAGLAAILAAAVAARLYQLNAESLWSDEVFSVYTASLPFNAMIDRLILVRDHVPLHYLLLGGWFHIFGFGDYQARLMAAAFGTGAVGAVYLFARELLGRRTAAAAGLLAAFSQISILYSQEARPYSQILFLYPLAAWLLLRSLREPDRLSRWCAFVVAATAMLYTHYYALFGLAALALGRVLLFREVPLRWKWILGAAVAAALAFAPWLLSGVLGDKFYGAAMVNNALSQTVHWWSAPIAVSWFHNTKWNGADASAPPAAILLGFAIFALPWAWATLRALLDPALLDSALLDPARREDRRAAGLLLLLSFVPILLAVLAGAAGVKYAVRYVLFAGAPYYILVAWGWTRLPGPKTRALFAAAALAVTVPALHAVYHVTEKQDYRAAVRWIARRAQPGDCWLVEPRTTAAHPDALWTIYGGPAPQPRVPQGDAAALASSGCPRIWALWDRTWWRNIRPEATARLHALENISPPIRRQAFFGQQVLVFEPARK